LHWVVVIVLLLRGVLSLKLLRIVALLLHWHRRVTTLISSRISSRDTRRIGDSAGGTVLPLRRLTSRRSVIARIAAAGKKKSGQANEAKSCNASNCASSNGAHGGAAFAAIGIGS
jgi:hypothetical protein